jgi:hypothetical protein
MGARNCVHRPKSAKSYTESTRRRDHVFCVPPARPVQQLSTLLGPAGLKDPVLWGGNGGAGQRLAALVEQVDVGRIDA